MLEKSFERYQSQARWFRYEQHAIAFWDSKGHLPTASRNKIKQNVLFLHGFPSASWDWHHQFKALSENYRCIAFDMLGFGISDKPKMHVYSIVEQAQIAQQLCDKLGIDKMHIVAHDYGVSVAQQFLYTKPCVISSICFLNGGLFAEMHRPLLTQKLLHSPLGPLAVKFLSKGSLKRSFTKIFGENTPPMDEDIDTLWRFLAFKEGKSVLPALLNYLDERVSYRDQWVDAMHKAQATIPMGFINGLEDPISGEHMLEKFKMLFPTAPSHALNVGHYPQLEASEEVSRLIECFICYQDFAQFRL